MVNSTIAGGVSDTKVKRMRQGFKIQKVKSNFNIGGVTQRIFYREQNPSLVTEVFSTAFLNFRRRFTPKDTEA